jgi:hypothetical protein
MPRQRRNREPVKGSLGKESPSIVTGRELGRDHGSAAEVGFVGNRGLDSQKDLGAELERIMIFCMEQN